MSNVVNRFTCSYDMAKTYVARKNAIKKHLQQCKSCSKSEINLHSSFTLLRICSSQYNAKIHEALLIKQSKPLRNKQLYGMVVPFAKNILIYFSYSVTIYQSIVFVTISLSYLSPFGGCFVMICLIRHNSWYLVS